MMYVYMWLHIRWNVRHKYKNTADEVIYVWKPFSTFLGGIFRSDLVSHNFDYICIQLFILYSVLNLSFYLIIMT